ncbi:transcription factor bHLH93-like isoform X2 [Vigna unguiculata]|uniref:transcription factor bHLH93-like isoform X2 n=1 Tax=Vigna unguiculata TaxID=3917 RepID=UPI00101685FF|nr:transcription factor bHLH93-like isoform X2 [Vigna unguiculata]
MELSQLGFLDELVAPRRETWNALSSGFLELLSNGWSFDTFLENPSFPTSNSLFAAFSTPIDRRFECPFTNELPPYPFPDAFTMPLPHLHPANDDPPPPLPPTLEDEDVAFYDNNNNFEEIKSVCKVEEQGVENPQGTEIPLFNTGMSDDAERKQKSKKLEGQPSKNLMAERRRRKRLNDRLSMLRSIVPKISKMDRTSILGDTIDYMKELLERIGKLQEEEAEEGSSQINLLGISKDQVKPNEAIVRNSPKFDVERRDQDTRISICCATKPGLLLSTVNTLEALGLEIQQCVVSSFNDFSVEASCSEVNREIALALRR